LAAKINIPYPDAATEHADPTAADHVYEAGAHWLVANTRERPKFHLLFKELTAYGYRRNALALKPLAITVCLASIAWVLYSGEIIGRHGFDWQAAQRLTAGAIGALVVIAILLVIWLAFFTPRSVKTASYTYATTLLSACESLT
jgi:hypothetical protein